jgi:hypothetical protein
MAKSNLTWAPLEGVVRAPAPSGNLEKKIPLALIKGLGIGGLKAKVKVERVKWTKLVRVEAISPQFALRSGRISFGEYSAAPLAARNNFK